jgi:hypothetical protein
MHHTKRRFRPHGGEPATFTAAPRRSFALDLDHLPCPAAIDPVIDPEGAIEYPIGLLPAELADASCWWQYTSSQSLPLPDGAVDTPSLSARLWYWHESPLSDADLKRWAAHADAKTRIVDPSLFHPIQAHYVAAPIFDGMADPLPRRCGVRRGLDDAVSLIIPPADAKDPESISGEGWEPSRGVEAYLAEIGGERGFREPIKSAIASFVAAYGSKADASKLKAAIREAIDKADPGGRGADVIERYKSDEHLDDLIKAIREIHIAAGDKPGVGAPIGGAARDQGDRPATGRARPRRGTRPQRR